MKNRIILVFILGLILAIEAKGQTLAEYIGNPDKSEIALEGKMDSSGNTVVVGYASNMVPDNLNYDYTQTDMLIVKVKQDGTPIWSRELGLNNNLEDMFMATDIEPNGDIIAVGSSERVPATFAYTGMYGKACIYKFDAATGNIIWSRHISIDNFNQVPERRGDIYIDVKVLPNGNILAVGEKDFSPLYSDGIITLFDADGNVLKSKVYNIPDNTSGLWHIAFDKYYIYVTGNQQGNSYMDMSVTKFDYDLNVIWNKNYDFGYENNNNQHMRDVFSLNDSALIVETLIDEAWGGSGATYTALTTLKKSDGSVLSNKVYINGGALVQGMSALYIASDNTQYLVSNPTTVPYDFYFPNYGIPGAVTIDGYVNSGYENTTTNTLEGSQMINSIDGNSRGNLLLCGTSKDDPAQIGLYDIYLQKEIYSAKRKTPAEDDCSDSVANAMTDTLSNTAIIMPNGLYDDVAYTLVPVQQQIDENISFVKVCGDTTQDNTSTDLIDQNPSQIQVFPNPAVDRLNIRFDSNIGKGHIAIYNTQGVLQYKAQFNTSNETAIKINTRNWAEGAYFLILKGAKQNVLRKTFIVKK